MRNLIESVSRGVPAALTEIITLGRMWLVVPPGCAGSRRFRIFVRDPASGLVRTERALEFHPGGRTVLGPGSRQLERMLERC